MRSFLVTIVTLLAASCSVFAPSYDDATKGLHQGGGGDGADAGTDGEASSTEGGVTPDGATPTQDTSAPDTAQVGDSSSCAQSSESCLTARCCAGLFCSRSAQVCQACLGKGSACSEDPQCCSNACDPVVEGGAPQCR
jgi:hypothetical protein